MGAIKFGNGVSEIRGKIGGNVYARNRGGSYSRAKVTPLNPQSTRQSAQRDAQSAVMKRWSANLTEPQRQAWIAAAEFITAKNIFGDSVKLTGIALYAKLNSVLQRIGQTIHDTVPTSFGVSGLSGVSMVADVSDNWIKVSFTPLPTGTGQRLLVYTTTALPAGRNPTKSDFSLLTDVIGTTTSPYDIRALWEARYGLTITAGKKIGVKLQLIDTTSGVVSSPIYTSAIVTA